MDHAEEMLDNTADSINFSGIRRWIGNGFKSQRQVEEEEERNLDARIEERRAQGKRPMEKKVEKKLENNPEETKV